jgi:PII-like signaling protein
MELKGEAKLIRIMIGETDKIEHIPVYEKIVIEARKAGLAGATVFKGIMGFGRNSRIHTAKILRLSEDLPLIIEIVDELEKIEMFLPILHDIFEEANCGGLITLEKADVIKYIATKKDWSGDRKD